MELCFVFILQTSLSSSTPDRPGGGWRYAVWPTREVVVGYFMFFRALLVTWFCVAYSAGAMAADMRVVSGGEGVTYITVQGEFEVGRGCVCGA